MSHQKGRLKNSKFWLCLSLILCLVSAIVASAVQTSGGIRIKEMREKSLWTPAGRIPLHSTECNQRHTSAGCCYNRRMV